MGSGLEIRRYTPKAEQLFNLIPGDVGRPIGQINPNFDCDDLEEMIRHTIDKVSPHGAVIAVIDIDAAKRWEAQLERSASAGNPGA